MGRPFGSENVGGVNKKGVFVNRCKREEWEIRLSLLSWCVSFKTIRLMVDISVQNGVYMYHGKENHNASYKHLQTTILLYCQFVLAEVISKLW